MIHIDSIKIYGFKASNRIAKAKFSKSSISVIYGPNGCGKTSFLKVLYGVLAQRESFLSENSVEKVVLEVSFNNEPSYISVFRKEEGDYDWTEILNSPLSSTSSLSLGVDRGTTSQSIKAEPSVIRRFFSHPYRRGYLSGGTHTPQTKLFRYPVQENTRGCRQRLCDSELPSFLLR